MVRSLIQSVIGQEAIEDNYLGWYLVSNRCSSNSNTIASTMVDTALDLATRLWYLRYRVPIPYAALYVDNDIRHCIQEISGVRKYTSYIEELHAKDRERMSVLSETLYKFDENVEIPLHLQGGLSLSEFGAFPTMSMEACHLSKTELPPSIIQKFMKEMGTSVVDISIPHNVNQADALISAQDFVCGLDKYALFYIVYFL